MLAALGLGGVLVLIAAENVFPPLPSEVVLLLAGVLVGEGRFDPVSALVFATAGSVLGALALYAAGARLGMERLGRFATNAGRPLGVRPGDLDRAEQWFDRHGAKVVFFGRLLPVLRSLVSVPAGSTRLPLGRFVALTAAGSALWNAAWITAGWALGEHWQRAESFSTVFEVGAVLAVGGLLAAGQLRRRRERAAARPVAAGPVGTAPTRGPAAAAAPTSLQAAHALGNGADRDRSDPDLHVDGHGVLG